jgi:hemoglobin/transferrin/lactoferrin receptor protein
MKIILSVITIIALTVISYAQKVTVINKSSLQPVENAVISDGQDAKNSVTTNSLGEADISVLSKSTTINVEAEGYLNRTFVYSSIESNSFVIELTDKSYTTDEIVVSTSKFALDKATQPQQIEQITSREISFSNQQNTGDLLMNTGEILVQKSQLGGGSPILRGFEASRVLVMVDGIRLNNAIFRAGHLQNILRIDENILDRVEVVFGPGSSIYGSDALGGSMNFYTKDPVLSTGKKTLFKIGAYGRFSSVDEEKSGHIDFNIGAQKIGFLGSFTFSDFGDMKQGKNMSPFLKGVWDKNFTVERINGRDTAIANPDPYKQIPTAYHKYDGLAKVLFQQNKNISHILSFRYSNTSDVPRYDRLTEVTGSGVPRSAEWYYGPEKWMMGSYNLKLNNMKTFFSGASLVLAYQDIEESRHNRNFQNKFRTDRTEKVKVYSANLDFNKKMKNNELSFGLEAYYNDVKSEAQKVNVDTDSTAIQSTRYPVDGSNMMTLAGYITDNWQVHKYVNVNAGVRFSHVSLNADFVDTTFFKFPYSKIEQRQSAVTGNLGVAINPGYGWRIALLGSTGFRAPNVDDLAKVFESTAGSYVVVPNPDLKPEYAYTGELSLSKIFENRIKLEGNVFYTMVRDIAVLAPFTFNGADSIEYDGVLTQVVANQNKEKGFIYGYNLNLDADITDWFSMFGNVTFTYGRVETDSTDEPLDHIPPVFGKTGIQLKFNRFKGEFNVMFNGWKHVWDYSSSGEDNGVYATSEGMPAWYTLNAKAYYQIHKYLQLQVGVENILDQRYRVFASGISGAGRNFVVTLRANY